LRGSTGKLELLLVDIPVMPDINYKYRYHLVFKKANTPIVANPEAPKLPQASGQGLAILPWVFFMGYFLLPRVNNAFGNLPGKPF
jgi:hypothetical protein